MTKIQASQNFQKRQVVTLQEKIKLVKKHLEYLRTVNCLYQLFP